MIKRFFSTVAEGFTSLVYPSLCLNCRRVVSAHQQPQLCMPCSGKLTYTRNWEIPENNLTDHFVGRLPIEFGAALLVFRTGTVTQSLIHALKYYERPEIGEQLGQELGTYLKDIPVLADLDGIVPVPIHPDRRADRGYNQAELIASGLAKELKTPQYNHALRRPVFSGSQTKRSRYERVENTRESFSIGEGDFANKHLLLVDDVVTTGATLDFCGNILLAHHPELRLSIATLAITEGG